LAALAVFGGAVKYKNDRAFASDVDFGIKIAEVAMLWVLITSMSIPQI